jgi:MGT family glycosyltransferase
MNINHDGSFDLDRLFSNYGFGEKINGEIKLAKEYYMSKVLFINGPAHGHINPTLSLVEELIRRGEEVTYFCTEGFRTKIENTGANFKSYDDLIENQLQQLVGLTHPFDKISILIQSSELLISNILKQVEGGHFDYIIHDSFLGSGNILGEILKLPTISTYTTFVPPAKLFQLDETIIRNDPKLKNFFVISNRLKVTYGIKAPSISEAFSNKGNLNIVFTSIFFQPGADGFDESYKFVGPSINNRNEQISFPFEKLKNKKVVYISLGTIVNFDSNFYKRCFEFFKNCEAIFILSIGNNLNIDDFTDIPENFIISNYVPQLEILKRANAFVTHGGMNSVSEALYYNVPLVVIPITADQPFVAQRVSELGAGISLIKDNVNEENLKHSLERIMNEEIFNKNAKQISESFKKAGGYKRAADEIFNFKSSI